MTDIDFDHHSRDYAENWVDIEADLRARCPVAHTNAHGGYWMLSKYRDVYEVARDDETFSSRDKVNLIPPLQTAIALPIDSDPPEHTRYRAIINKFFTPTRLAPLEPIIDEMVVQRFTAARERGRIDFITDLANPVPAITTMLLLGLDPDYWEMFAEPVHNLSFMPPGSPERAAAQDKAIAFEDVLREETDRRIAEPQGDMISDIAHSVIDGVPTSREEAVSLVILLIHAGVDTVTSAMGNMLLYLGRHEQSRRRLQEDRGLIRRAIEELLRVEPPVPGFARLVTRDCVIGGREIPKGDRVFMSWSSANRDEDEFPDADQVVLDRSPNRHMTFGIGNHRCAGSTLARMELSIVLNRMLDLIPNYRIDESGVIEARDIGHVHGRRNIPAWITGGSE